MDPSDKTWNPYAATTSDLTPIPALPDPSPPASRLTRLGAKLLDNSAYTAATFLFVWWRAHQTPELGFLLVLASAATAVWAISSLRSMHRSGQTWGKKVLKIKVVRGDGTRLGLGRWLLLRLGVACLVARIPVIGPYLLLFDPLFIFRRDRRCLHDVIADTKVVEA